ncbi:MAG: hypothetical protein AAF743_14500, partial [Planctomycetota bacterium]
HEMVINAFKPTRNTFERTAEVELDAGQHDILIEYYTTTGFSNLFVTWQAGGPDGFVRRTIQPEELTPQYIDLEDQIDAALAFNRDQIARAFDNGSTPAGGSPVRGDSADAWVRRESSYWTSGYYAGVLWQMDRYYDGAGWDVFANEWTTPQLGETNYTGDHFSRVFPAVEREQSADARQAILDAAAARIASFDATVGAFDTPEIVEAATDPSADFGLLMDQTMDQEVIYRAIDLGADPSWATLAETHFETVLDQLVRPDGSVIQRGFFDSSTGNRVEIQNYQGLDDDSTWSRAQAWAVYSFAFMAERTGRADFIAAARNVADYWLANVPDDGYQGFGVPYWDFDAPADPGTPRDSSAAAIVAVGLQRLGRYLDDDTYTDAAESTLCTLLGHRYMVGNTSLPGTRPGLIDLGSQGVPQNRGIEVPLVFGDYYTLLAVNEYLEK